MTRLHAPDDHPSTRHEDRPELVTPTGWRVIGSATELLSDPTGIGSSAALAPDHLLYAARFVVRPKSARGDGVGVVLSVLNAAVSLVREGGEELGRDNSFLESSGRFHGLKWDTFEEGVRWGGELTWIHPHPVITGTPCTTHASITQHGDRVELTVHVGTQGGVAAVRGYVGAGQARPSFLPELHRLARLSFNDANPDIGTLDIAGVDAFVERVLLSHRRTHPIAVLAPIEPSGSLDPVEYLVPPEQVATELLGLAHLWVIDQHPTTFRLTDAVRDKRLSCFWGALRVYMPGFTRSDRGHDHPLLVQDRVSDPVERCGLLGEIALMTRGQVPVTFPVVALRESAEEHDRKETDGGDPTIASGPVAEAQAEPMPFQSAGAGPGADTPDPVLLALNRLTETIAGKLDAIAGLQERLIDEVSRLRTATAVRSANTGGIERRLGQFERILRDLTRPPGTEEPNPVERVAPAEEGGDEDVEFNLLKFLQGAASAYAEDLLFLDSAFASAADSPYEGVLRVATNLKAMAELARRRQEGRLGMSLRDAFAEAGVEYRGGISPSTSKRLRQQYEATLPNGQVVECCEHIVLGDSYDPRYCLRIYFSSRAPGEPRFVIAHVGRHYEGMTTT